MFRRNTATIGNLILWIILMAVVTTVIGYVLITMPHDSWGMYYALKGILIRMLL